MAKERTEEHPRHLPPSSQEDNVPLVVLANLAALHRANDGKPIPVRAFNSVLFEYTNGSHEATGRLARALQEKEYVEPRGRGTPGLAYQATEALLTAAGDAPSRISMSSSPSPKRRKKENQDVARLKRPATTTWRVFYFAA